MEEEISLKQISERLAMPIGQLHERADVIRRCKLAEVPFEAVEFLLCANGMVQSYDSTAPDVDCYCSNFDILRVEVKVEFVY